MIPKTDSNNYSQTDLSPSNCTMTLLLGARCNDGVALVADRKVTTRDGLQPQFADKIRGELLGIRIGFSGDRFTFELFGNRIRNYVKTFTECS